jgi:hypothetical protein
MEDMIMAETSWYTAVEPGKGQHLVYLSKEAKELDKLLQGKKNMIIRGGNGKKNPYGRVFKDDALYFVQTADNNTIKAKAIVKKVINTDKMTEEESIEIINKYKDNLNLSNEQYKRWAGKKYFCLIEVANVEIIDPFTYKRTTNMDDWIITDDINKIKA